MSFDAELSELLSGPVSSLPVPQAQSLPATSAVMAGGGAYEGASGFDQLALWQPPIQSADADILPDKEVLDSRVLDMLRNDAYVAGGRTLHQDNIVGSIYLLNAKPMTKVLWGKDDDIWEEEFQEEVETKFMLWAESAFNWSDAQGTKTLTDQVRLAVALALASGEVLATAEWKPNDGRPYRTAVQMVDTARLCDPPNTWTNKRRIRGGVEQNQDGEPIAYHIRMGDPMDYALPGYYQWRRVMARKPWGRPQVLHIFDQIRAEQSRGVSSMVAALQEMKMLKSFRKVELQRAVLAATYAASIESELPDGDVFTLLGGNQGTGNPVIDYQMQFLNMMQDFVGGAKNLDINGAKIPILPAGVKLNLKNPGADSPAGDKFEMSALRYVASVLGVSYEQLSRDYTNTNYSSARASRGETEKHMASRKKKVADGYANFLYGLWLEEAINQNSLECLKRKNVPAYYDGLNREAYTSCDWLGAGAGLIDPLKEIQAYVLALNNKIGTRERVIARLYGSDWRRELRQISREEAAYAKAGIDLQPTANQDMQNALSGSPAKRGATSAALDRAMIEQIVADIMESRS
ncbi:portal protein [Asticcacaulis sp. AC466]|uniref:phage portal protein n=1 Tax=Asticcacaulis sp. AC466 TaxID=1282362 RepID=UPI0003C3CE8C|nr:phage portal protein [Asticcacaulis sp. AC466]ESQ85499.1 portal protein [Asticcacaulis sp. AC466]